MAKWLQSSLRIPVLAVLFSGALLVVGRAIVTPKLPDAPVSVAAFPPTVPIEGWQLTTTAALKPTEDGIGGQSYQYRQNSQGNQGNQGSQGNQNYSNAPVLDVELRKMTGDGNVSRFLFVYSSVKQGNDKIQERQRSETGAYALLSHAGRAYLTACINPEGNSTVTEQQFIQNRSQNLWQVSRVVTWMMGQGPLSDKRCLWTLMSVPIDATKPPAAASEAAYQTLETAWVSWYRWWKPNFPPVSSQ